MPDAGLPPLPESEWDDETRAMLSPDLPGGGRVLNIFATLSRHPKLMKRWLVFGSHVLAKSTLPARDRELLILRTGWRCRAPYEWGQHVVIARAAGITDVEIAQIAAGPDDRGWHPFEATLLRAADELHDDLCVSEPTWHALADRYTEQQLLDLLFCVGQYHLVSMALNSLRVARDDNVEGVPFPERSA